MDAVARFWRKVAKEESGKITRGSYCWLWVAGKNDMGYGLFNRGTRPSKCVLAHRFSYELHSGIHPGPLCVLHHCDTPSCVNPGHLFTGTRGDNAADKIRKGRQRGPRGVNHPKAKLTADLVIQMRIDFSRRGNASKSQFYRRYLDVVTPTTVRYIVERKTWKGSEYEP